MKALEGVEMVAKDWTFMYYQWENLAYVWAIEIDEFFDSSFLDTEKAEWTVPYLQTSLFLE